jgi:glycine oxidase
MTEPANQRASPENQADAAPQAKVPGTGPGAHLRSPAPDVLVIGGGVIGLAIAWRSACRDLQVAVADPSPLRGATWAAAGMLAPVTEVHYGEEALLRLNLSSAAAWPAFAASLEEASGREVGYRPCGTLAVAMDGGDRAALEELYRYQLSLGLKAELLTSRECRSLEPFLAPGIRGGLLASGDHQVHNRLLGPALQVAAERAGVRLIRDRVVRVLVDAGQAKGVVLASGEHLSAGAVVLAAGCWTSQIAGLADGTVPPVRPVKGQILRLKGPAEAPLLGRNLRGLVAGTHLYLVPRADGTMVVGATVEEQGFDVTVRAGAVADMLRDARALLPALDELELSEAWAGLRPGSPDNAPIIGPSALPGLVVATGHYRNGILLTPVTADSLAAVLAGQDVPQVIAPFSPRRFEPAGEEAVAPQLAGAEPSQLAGERR